MSKAISGNASLAAKVERHDADLALKRVINLGLLDGCRKVLRKGTCIEIPVKGPISGLEMVSQEVPEFYKRAPDIASALLGKLPSEAMDLLPRGWYILGDIIIVKIHPYLAPYQRSIGEALLKCYPRCVSVFRDYGVEGQLREPVRDLIAGTKTETIHRENGVLFKLDARKVMFSPGNLKERMRMSHFGNNEFVIDMFAGIGYFTLPMAVYSRPKKVMAIELNPNAYHYLCQNIKLNHVNDIVDPVLGDCEKETPDGVADRVIMGMVQITDKYLHKGIQALRSGGVLHYHQTIPSWKYPSAAVEDVTAAAKDRGFKAEILKYILVKKYSPGVVHAVVDARIDKG